MSLRVVASIALIAACGGAPRRSPTPANESPARTAPSAEQCDTLLEELSNLEFRESESQRGWRFGPSSYGEDRHEYRKERKKTKGARFINLCREQVPLERVECGLAAEELAAAIRCDARFDLEAL